MPLRLAILILSASAIAYEVLLIRLFSIIQWQQFAAMVISLALLGYGASGSVLALTRSRWLEGRDPRRLGTLTRLLKTHLRATPAARAALDMALYDLVARHLDVPLTGKLAQTAREAVSPAQAQRQRRLGHHRTFFIRGILNRPPQQQIGQDIGQKFIMTH